MTTSALHVTKIEDHEGFGRCGHCDRENLRWIVVLSDGTRVGTECAKRVLGINVKPNDYTWLTDYDLVAEHVTAHETFALYQLRGGTRTRLAINGHLAVNGNGRAYFERYAA